MRNNNLYTRLKEYESKGYSSFHTPGHKCSGFLPQDLIKLDLTELPDTDELFEAHGIIRETEKMFSQIYGTADTFISAGGCTLAIQAMMRTALERGGKLLCSRNAHRSAVNAMALLDIDPVWIYPKGERSYTGRIEPDDVRSAFEKESDIRSVYITSPSYYGEMSDIKQIADICHENNAILLVDNAHGSHLAFMSENKHPITLGADMTACSLHKTLPVMTGGALLNVRTKELAENGRSYMSLFASTSPSYVVMSSMALCADYILNGNGISEYRDCEIKVKKLRKYASERGIISPRGECDPLRLTLNTSRAGLCGEEEQQVFFHSHGIECEFCDGENAVLIITPFNTDTDLERVKKAIDDLPAGKDDSEKDIIKEIYHPVSVMSVRRAMLSKRKKVKAVDALGMISADTSCPCPPGVPVIMPGERIDEAQISQLGSQNIFVVNNGINE